MDRTSSSENRCLSSLMACTQAFPKLSKSSSNCCGSFVFTSRHLMRHSMILCRMSDIRSGSSFWTVSVSKSMQSSTQNRGLSASLQYLLCFARMDCRAKLLLSLPASSKYLWMNFDIWCSSKPLTTNRVTLHGRAPGLEVTRTLLLGKSCPLIIFSILDLSLFLSSS